MLLTYSNRKDCVMTPPVVLEQGGPARLGTITILSFSRNTACPDFHLSHSAVMASLDQDTDDVQHSLRRGIAGDP